MPGRAAGFCVYNDTAAVAIADAARCDGAERVAYVDVDVHHGDGVERACSPHDPRVLTISLHESGRTLFPGTGDATDVGVGAGRASVGQRPARPADVGGRCGSPRSTRSSSRSCAPSSRTCWSRSSAATRTRTDPLAHLALTLDDMAAVATRGCTRSRTRRPTAAGSRPAAAATSSSASCRARGRSRSPRCPAGVAAGRDADAVARAGQRPAPVRGAAVRDSRLIRRRCSASRRRVLQARAAWRRRRSRPVRELVFPRHGGALKADAPGTSVPPVNIVPPSAHVQPDDHGLGPWARGAWAPCAHDHREREGAARRVAGGPGGPAGPRPWRLGRAASPLGCSPAGAPPSTGRRTRGCCAGHCGDFEADAVLA